MKTVKKNIYYCDFCKKRGLQGWRMKKHERGCTNNPDRVCGVCKASISKDIIAGFKERFEILIDPDTGKQHVDWKGDKITLAEIKEAIFDCPACVLSVLRQTKLFYDCCGLEKFDYKKEYLKYMSDKAMESEDNWNLQ
jgi:hypothetical protein